MKLIHEKQLRIVSMVEAQEPSGSLNAVLIVTWAVKIITAETRVKKPGQEAILPHKGLLNRVGVGRPLDIAKDLGMVFEFAQYPKLAR